VGNLDSNWKLPALWLNSFHDTSDAINDIVVPALHNYKLFRIIKSAFIPGAIFFEYIIEIKSDYDESILKGDPIYQIIPS